MVNVPVVVNVWMVYNPDVVTVPPVTVGLADVVIEFDAAEAAPLPTVLFATTVNVYDVLGDKPSAAIGDEVPVV